MVWEAWCVPRKLSTLNRPVAHMTAHLNSRKPHPKHPSVSVKRAPYGKLQTLDQTGPKPQNPERPPNPKIEKKAA